MKDIKAGKKIQFSCPESVEPLIKRFQIATQTIEGGKQKNKAQVVADFLKHNITSIEIWVIALEKRAAQSQIDSAVEKAIKSAELKLAKTK